MPRDLGDRSITSDMQEVFMPDNDFHLDPDALWNDQEAALFLGRSARTVRRWRRQGKLPTVLDPGGYWRFRSGSLRELVRENEGWLR